MPTSWSRRLVSGALLWALVTLAGTVRSLAGPAFIEETDSRYLPTGAERAAIAGIVGRFMEKYQIPGLSLAMARHGRFVYREAFGLANRETGEKVTPDHLFRIASISKPITAAGIFLLRERGKLQLDSRVFGPGSLLGFDFGETYPERVQKVTVDNLLGHTAGGWGNDGSDPMFRRPRAHHAELISRTLQENDLASEPGEKYAYSNFGYCVLGRVIEKVTGEPYENWIRRNVLKPSGIRDMRIAGNTRAEKAPLEVTYYSQADGDPYRPNVRRMDAHGGWLGTATDLVLFANHVDGFDTTPSLLTPESIHLMTTPGKASPNYARGWNVNAEPNWWHGGSLPGTSTILVRSYDNFCWAALANTRTPGIDLALDRMMWEIKQVVPGWRNR